MLLYCTYAHGVYFNDVLHTSGSHIVVVKWQIYVEYSSSRRLIYYVIFQNVN